jgi:fumarate hydratase subunit alpha
VRKIKSKIIIEVVANLCAKANFEFPEDVLGSIQKNIAFETGLAKSILEEINENADIAKTEQIPLCQDTGVPNFFVKFGKDVSVEDGDIYDSINKGVSLGYGDNYLRKSIVYDPIERKSAEDGMPANVYVDIVSGDEIEITFLPKGGGSENASALKMLIPSVGWNGVKEFVLKSVDDKGRNACPPLVVGVGIGGDFASIGLVAKKAILRKIGSNHQIAFYKEKELELLNEINKLDIGPMGIGGKTTALAVFIEVRPTHIASLPVAVNIQCHSCRRKTIII